MKLKKNKKIPSYFKPLLWSYDFSKINPAKSKKRIIINTINYGDLKHWRWLTRFYGAKEVKKILSHLPVTEIKPRNRRLASLIFKIKDKDYVYKGIRRKK